MWRGYREKDCGHTPIQRGKVHLMDNTTHRSAVSMKFYIDVPNRNESALSNGSLSYVNSCRNLDDAADTDIHRHRTTCALYLFDDRSAEGWRKGENRRDGISRNIFRGNGNKQMIVSLT